MNRVIAFSRRNFMEIMRDPLSYIFCLGFPLVMLIIMTLVNESIPAEAGMVIFRIDNLSGGIAVFGLTFIMLFTGLSVAKDRAGSFLVRLYTTPMRSCDFITGYIAPVMAIALAQVLITFAASFAISVIAGIKLSAAGLGASMLALVPTAVMMIGFGLLFGSLFGEKAAPGLCSIVISLASFLGGVWFDPDSTGGILLKICKALPFYHSVHAARLAASLNFKDFWGHLGITAAWAVVITIAAVLMFKAKMKSETC